MLQGARGFRGGRGLGLRRSLMDEISEAPAGAFDFLEVAPENWIGVGGRAGRKFAALAEHYPVLLHGLSLNLGGFSALDRSLVERIRAFKLRFNCPHYSEHLSYCADDGHLYELLPIPFTEEAVHHVAGRIRQVQDMLGERIAVENASYYCAPGQQLSELDFIRAVLDEADCELLLDVNNVYVNALNHGYDAWAFLEALPGERISYLHVAGHDAGDPTLLVDTHGEPVIDPVWRLLARAYQLFGVKPTLLERDFNIPPLSELLRELDQIGRIQAVTPGGAGHGH